MTADPLRDANKGIVEVTYNRKEWEDAFGLHWYHYGARFYDSAVAGTPEAIDKYHPPE